MKHYVGLLVVLIGSISLSSQFSHFGTKLPLLRIKTQGQYPIAGNKKRVATLQVQNNWPGKINSSAVTAKPEMTFTVGIKTRGDTSNTFPKKQYSLEIWKDAGGDSLKIPLLGMKADDDWILNGPYVDKSLLRNTFTYEVSRQMGHWAPHSRYVELIVNNEYKGIYILLERIKRSRLKSLKAKDGGFIVQLGSDIKTVSSTGFRLMYPSPDKSTALEKNNIKKRIETFEHSLKTGSYFQSANVKSFVDYFIIQELSKNTDGFRRSHFTHLNKDNQITMGPIWDFNIAYGNMVFFNGKKPTGWVHGFKPYVFGGEEVWWWKRLVRDPHFVKAIQTRWVDLRKTVLTKNNIHKIMNDQVFKLDKATERNFIKWPVLGLPIINLFGFDPAPWPNSHKKELIHLNQWILKRVTWLDQNIPKL